MNGLLETWYLSAGPAVLAVAGTVATALKMKRALAEVGAGLRRREHLPGVKAAIESGMRLSAFFVLLYALLLAGLLAGVAMGWLTLAALGLHILAFGLIAGPAGLWARRFEKRLQTLETTDAEPGVEAVYTRWLAEWKKPRLTLSQP